MADGELLLITRSGGPAQYSSSPLEDQVIGNCEASGGSGVCITRKKSSYTISAI